MNQDHEHLRLLSIFHYVFGGLTALFSLFPLIYLVMGLVFLMAPGEMGFDATPPGMEGMEELPAEELPDAGADDAEVGGEADEGGVPADQPFANPAMDNAAMGRFVGGMFIVLGTLGFVLGMVCAALVIAAGRNLAAHRGYVFCLVVAALECLSVPFGTILGVFTIVVLQRESVKELFGQRVALEEASTY